MGSEFRGEWLTHSKDDCVCTLTGACGSSLLVTAPIVNRLPGRPAPSHELAVILVLMKLDLRPSNFFLYFFVFSGRPTLRADEFGSTSSRENLRIATMESMFCL